MNKTPVNLITGFLGVGKTTVVRHLLANKPAGEFWAVLVNEFGEIGIDGAAIESAADGLNVVEVPGGCICCTTSPMLRVSLTRLLRERKPDRLLIEPSGLGHPAGIIDLLRDPFLSAALELRAVVTLVDPRQLDDSRYTLNDTWRDQSNLADVLVANKADRADAAQIDRFERMAAALFPPKAAWLSCTQGQLDPALLDVVREDIVPAAPQALRPVPRRSPADTAGANAQVDTTLTSAEVRDNQVGEQASRGWRWPAELVFSAERLAQLFQSLGQPGAYELPAIARAKGVLHTDHGWLLFNWVAGETSAVEIAWRRDSRVEVIVAGSAAQWLRLESALDGCLLELLA
jgi:G3E family GTPase